MKNQIIRVIVLVGIAFATIGMCSSCSGGRNYRGMYAEAEKINAELKEDIGMLQDHIFYLETEQEKCSYKNEVLITLIAKK
jgi:hypothetical protein